MLRNYFKIAIAVLKRRKFFTFISLFGISFTLTILMVMTAFIDKVVADDYPHKKRSRLLFVQNIEENNPKNGNGSSGMPSYYYFDHYVRTLSRAENLAIFSEAHSTNSYIDNRKIAINYKFTDAAYWEVLDYAFLEGKPFSRQQVDAHEPVAVISSDMKRDYFGDVPSVVGKYIEVESIKFRVCGVVRPLPSTTYMLYSDIYLPYTLSKENVHQPGLRGGYLGILLARSEGEVKELRRDYDALIPKLPKDEGYTEVFSHADPYVISYVRSGNEAKSGLVYAITAIAAFVLIVMLLPTVNLININMTRIMERSSEIGVRKAFGASSRMLVYQFVIENLLLTVLGGLIGLVFSWIVLLLLNQSHLIANLELALNWQVLGYCLIACVIFGLLSGVYPAWRMSRLNVVAALKAGQ